MPDSDPRETRLKRLSMRSWRRGTREMDLILGLYADGNLVHLPGGTLDLYETLLEENDQDIYPWITGAAAPPPAYAGLIAEIGRYSLTRRRKP